MGKRAMGQRTSGPDLMSLAPSDVVWSRRDKATSLALLLGAQVAAMSVWFSSSAAMASIKRHAAVTPMQEAVLTNAVQVGFVLGTIVSALLCLADRYDPRRLFGFSALVAAVATGSLVLLPPSGIEVVLLRFLTGVCMAGVYPVGMRMVAAWANRDLGLLIGLLVGALTLGSASPHLLAAYGTLDWRTIYVIAAAGSAIAALLVCIVKLGPNSRRAATVDVSQVAQSWRCPSLRLVNLGYLGHMWELYALWAWLAVFLRHALAGRGFDDPDAEAAWLTFLAIAAGAVGAWLGGLRADRHGRTCVTIGAMAVSGTCAAVAGWLDHAPLIVLMTVVVIWGVAVIADSAQFSASIAELAEPTAIGTLLTAQTCAGFLLTMASIQLLPVVLGHAGWRGAFTMLALGPLVGCLAMWRLRSTPDAKRLAGGKK